MIVEPQINVACGFESIKQGECFIYGNDYFMKTKPLLTMDYEDEIEYNAISLVDGTHRAFKTYDMVQSVNMKLLRIEE